jgi:hypothetical protein
MKALMIVLLAALLGPSVATTAAVAQSSAPTSVEPSTASGDMPKKDDHAVATPASPDAPGGGREAPAASPRTVEPPRILGMRASMVIFGGAALFFIVVLFAAEISRRTPRYRRTDIDPHR